MNSKPLLYIISYVLIVKQDIVFQISLFKFFLVILERFSHIRRQDMNQIINQTDQGCRASQERNCFQRCDKNMVAELDHMFVLLNKF